MFVALIPARKGSKGLPEKNTIELCGRPCISYTIEAAIQSKVFDEVIVSSNDTVALEIANQYSISTVQRPERICKDTSSAADVVEHIILAKGLEEESVICYLQPTSPLRNANHIKEAAQLYHSAQRPLVSVKEATENPYKMFEVYDSQLRPLFGEHYTNTRRQDLPRVFTPNGAIYIFSVKSFLKRNSFPSNGGIPFIMKHHESWDLDCLEDKTNIETEMANQFSTKRS